MIVRVAEMGNRPAMWTKARRFAPAGAQQFGETLGHLQFADAAMIVLDWSNVLAKMPSDVARPILYISVAKKLPEYETNNLLRVDCRLDVDDTFGGDNVTAEVIVDIIRELEETVTKKVAQRRAG